MVGGRIRLVAAVQEGGGELDRQKACEEQADDGEEDADACVHEDHSLFVGREIDGGRIAARQADMLVRRVLVCIAPPGLGTGRVGQPASGGAYPAFQHQEQVGVERLLDAALDLGDVGGERTEVEAHVDCRPEALAVRIGDVGDAARDFCAVLSG